jgi:hypothetical protein
MVESKFSTNVHLAPWPTTVGSCRRTPGRYVPAAVPRAVKFLPQWDTATGAYFLRQAVHRGARTLLSRGTTAGARRRGARRQGLFFLVFEF